MVTYGDAVTDLDINKVVSFHKSHGKLVTVTGVRPTARFGELKIAENNIKQDTDFEILGSNSNFDSMAIINFILYAITLKNSKLEKCIIKLASAFGYLSGLLNIVIERYR